MRRFPVSATVQSHRLCRAAACIDRHEAFGQGEKPGGSQLRAERDVSGPLCALINEAFAQRDNAVFAVPGTLLRSTNITATRNIQNNNNSKEPIYVRLDSAQKRLKLYLFIS